MLFKLLFATLIIIEHREDDFDEIFDENFYENSSLQCSVFTTLISKPDMGVVIEADEGGKMQTVLLTNIYTL